MVLSHFQAREYVQRLSVRSRGHAPLSQARLRRRRVLSCSGTTQGSRHTSSASRLPHLERAKVKNATRRTTAPARCRPIDRSSGGKQRCRQRKSELLHGAAGQSGLQDRFQTVLLWPLRGLSPEQPPCDRGVVGCPARSRASRPGSLEGSGPTWEGAGVGSNRRPCSLNSLSLG